MRFSKPPGIFPDKLIGYWIEHRTSRTSGSCGNIEYRVSSIEHRASSIEYRVSNIEHRASNIDQLASNIEHRTSNIEPAAGVCLNCFVCLLVCFLLTNIEHRSSNIDPPAAAAAATIRRVRTSINWHRTSIHRPRPAVL
jgi:hypothetical protein